MEKTVIATYKSPDLDGFACGYALEEWHRRKKIKSVFGLFGNIQLEVEFMIKNLKLRQIKNGIELLSEESKIILVDASDTWGLASEIQPEKVVEVIDHRRNYDKYAFINAKYQVEFVGAAATLIAEKYMADQMEISQESASLLFYAIVSNTINFKANVTTNRDLDAANWLKEKGNFDQDLTNEIFAYKSKNILVQEDFFLKNYSAFPKLQEKHFGIIQLEIVKANEFITNNISKLLKIAKKIKFEKKLDFMFYTIIDIEEGSNYFITSDKPTKMLLKQSLGITLKKEFAKRKGVLMRKEIVMILRQLTL